MVHARNKGARSEREFFDLINGLLGVAWLKRNLSQTRGGGQDSDDLLPVAIEVKRQEVLRLAQWLSQARSQAQEGETPVLAYRQSREPWTILVDMSPDEFADYLRWRSLRIPELETPP